jgi:hypothetical protein
MARTMPEISPRLPVIIKGFQEIHLIKRPALLQRMAQMAIKPMACFFSFGVDMAVSFLYMMGAGAWYLIQCSKEGCKKQGGRENMQLL